jgi:HNH endonuclease
MRIKSVGPGKPGGRKRDEEGIRRVVSKARRTQADRENIYREQSLKIHPWVCARCGREFTNRNLHLLTVHHKDHNHDNNPSDGSNWENLCVYCHENEHRRYLDHSEGGGAESGAQNTDNLTHNPFAALGNLVKDKEDE